MAKKRTEEVVISEDSNGDERRVVVIRPDSKKLSEAQKVYNKYFRDALESGASDWSLALTYRLQKFFLNAQQTGCLRRHAT